jgi:hypothetical protein
VSFAARTRRCADSGGSWRRIQGRLRWPAGIRVGAGAATSAALAAACVMALATPAGASTGSPGTGGFRPVGTVAGRGGTARQVLHLRAMPAGTVTLGRHRGRVARVRIAETRRLLEPGAGWRPHRLIAVEVSPAGTSFGALRGRATLS